MSSVKLKLVARLGCCTIVWIFSSCETFLDVDLPKSKIQKSDVFENEVTADQAIIGIYTSMISSRAFACGDEKSISSICGLSADELVNYPRNEPDPQEFDENDLRAQNLSVLELWTSLYKTIFLCNSAIEGLDAATKINNEVKLHLKGEALFVRAFCNFYLVNLFGDVPLITTTNYTINSTAPRNSMDEVYEQILADLLDAKTLLTEEYIGVERIRPNRVAAVSLLARVYLFREEWENAEQQATEVIDNINYSLTDLDQVFLSNSLETIWQLKPGVSPNNGDLGATNEASIFSPPTLLRLNVLRLEVVNAFESNDQRFVEWVQKYTTVYRPYKYRKNVATTKMTEYSAVIRLAELILVRAEARAQLENFTGANSAESDINEIRERAGLTPVTALTKAQMLLAIEQERRVEFFTEWGHRWLDLKRTNRVNAVLDPLKPKWSGVDALYPIPQKERMINRNLNPQNPGY